MTRHEFKDQNILAIEDGMAPPSKRMKVASDEDIRNLVHIWETQPMRISLEDHIVPSKHFHSILLLLYFQLTITASFQFREFDLMASVLD